MLKAVNWQNLADFEKRFDADLQAASVVLKNTSITSNAKVKRQENDGPKT